MSRVIITAALSALGLVTADAAAAYPLSFPARATSLALDTYFSTGGHKGYAGKPGGTTWALDIGVVRFDGEWIDHEASATSPYTLDENLGYGTPLYASTDGVVVACWWDLPDAPDAESNNCDPDCPPGHTSGGNHIAIVVPDGSHVVFHGHLAQGSIPPELCPIVDADGLIDDMSKVCSGGSGFRNSTRLDAILPLDQLPVVRKGDYIGDLGHSGESSAPHLHLQVNPFFYDDDGNPCQGDSVPIEFVETWQQLRSATGDATVDGWQPLDEAVVPIDASDNRFLLWPDPLGARKQDLVLGAGNSIDVETDMQGGMVAYRNASNQLRLTSFYIGTGGDDGDLIAQSTRSEGGVQLLDLVKLPVSERAYALVIRGSNGKLKVIPYRAHYSTGDITRPTGDLEDMSVSRIAAVASPSHNGVVVAVREADTTLGVFDYVAANDTLTITRPGSSSGGGQAITDVAITAVKGAYKGVVTAEVTPLTGVLTLRSFEITAGGDVFADDVEVAPGQVEDVELTTIDGLAFPTMATVAVALRDTNDALHVQTWSVANNGALTLLDQTSAGTIGVLDVAAVKGRDIVTGVAESDNDLSLLSWSTDWAGDTVRRAGTRTAGEIQEVDVASYHGTPGANTVASRWRHVLTGVRTGAGDLKVLSHGANYSAWY